MNEHLDEVKKELGQLVNAEFEKFISLYSSIGDIANEEIEALNYNISHLKDMNNVQATNNLVLIFIRMLKNN